MNAELERLFAPQFEPILQGFYALKLPHLLADVLHLPTPFHEFSGVAERNRVLFHKDALNGDCILESAPQ